MNTGSIIQVGEAVRHKPLTPLTPFNEPSLVEESGEKIIKHVKETQLGGFISGGQLSWRVNGPTIEILDPSTWTRLAAWTFGAILHNSSAVITCVCGIGVGTVSHVAIGIDLGIDRNPQGMVSILSLRRSRITRAFQFRHKVTNICMVTGGEKLVDPSTFALELRSCQGLLAVATANASLFLVDLAFDLGADEVTSDEISPALFVDIMIPDANADYKRNEAVSRGLHPLLCLSENFNSNGMFQLLGPDDNILFEAPSHSVNISSILYIPQLASLVVGYNFGSFQIINLSIITIDCASPYEDNSPPVFAFSYQEPENDPRSFVYLWVCRSWPCNKGSKYGYRNSAKNGNERSTCSLYAMNYDKKEWIEGHGLWYQGLQSMSPRFEFDTSASLDKQLLSLSPCSIYSMMTVVGVTPASSAISPLNPGSSDILVPSDEESDPVPELSLCMFCWEGTFLEEGREVLQHYIAIFDINQWYQAQMPGHLRIEEHSLCPYMSFHILDKVPRSMNEKLLSAAPKMGSWSRHSSRSHCETDWYPSSLSYELNLLTSEGFVTYHCPSVQQSAILSLMQQGPGAIVYPHTAFSACLFAGILPPEITHNGIGSSTVSERENLLNVALEYHLLSLIIQCIVEFSEGRFSHVGCTLHLLLEWAWNKIRTLKESYNTLCSPLFAISEEACILNDSGLAILHQNLTYLSHLHTIVSAIRDNSGEITSISAGELEGRVQVTYLLKLHLQSVLWFYHCGLLPQCNPDDVLDGKAVPFPSDTLYKIYDKRRSEIKKLSSSLIGSDLLLIDCMIEEAGSLLPEAWVREGHEDSKCLYPPPNLFALLSMYLLPGMSTFMKHRIIQYLFLDLASLLSDNYLNIVEELVKFPSSVSLSPSIIKLTQAFWLIDQKDFETGLSVLLDPLVDPNDITPQQHRRIVKSFLYQGEEGYALSYTQLRHPPEVDLEDIRINLTVLLANGRIREAFHYQRKRRVPSNAKNLLDHLFKGCEQLGRLESIVHLPLSPMEEETFITYLYESTHPAAQDILLVYYLQQSRFGEIRNLNDRFKNSSSSVSRQNTRTALVQGYLSHLPDIRAQLSSSQNGSRATKTIYTKPQPLSACIRQSTTSLSTPISKATLQRNYIHDVEDRLASKTQSAYTPFRSKAQRKKIICNEELGLIAHSTLETEQEFYKGSSEIVFPMWQDEGIKDKLSVRCSLLNSSLKYDYQVPTTSKEMSSLKEDISKALEDLLRKSFNSSIFISKSKTSKISAEVVSLLKTPPPLDRRKSINTGSSSKHNYPETPQSILKVRKILQRPLSPSPDVDNPVATFPLHRHSLTSPIEKSLDKSSNASESSAMTPKQLRFDLPVTKLSVDDDNMIVNDITPPLNEIDSSSDGEANNERLQLSPEDIPTPRKPLPRYVGSSNILSYGLSTDREDKDSSSVRKYKFVNEVKDSSKISHKTLEKNDEESSCASSISSELTNSKETESVISSRVSLSPPKNSNSQTHPEEEFRKSSSKSPTGKTDVSSQSFTDDTNKSVKKFLNDLFGSIDSKTYSDSSVTKEILDQVGDEIGLEVSSPPADTESSLMKESNVIKNVTEEVETGDSTAESVLEDSFYSIAEDNEDDPNICDNNGEKESDHSLKLSDSISQTVMNFTKTVEDRYRKVSEVISNYNVSKILSPVVNSTGKSSSSVPTEEPNTMFTQDVNVSGDILESDELCDNKNVTSEKNNSVTTPESTYEETVIEVTKVSEAVVKELNEVSEDHLDSNYILQFSDSEDENKQVSPAKTSHDEVPSLSRASTVLIDSDNNNTNPTNRSIYSSTNLVETLQSESKKKSDFSQPSSQLTSMPSDFENLPNVFLNDREKRVIESVLKAEDIEGTKSKDHVNNSLDRTYIPILEFSEDESDKEKLVDNQEEDKMPLKKQSNVNESNVMLYSNDNLVNIPEEVKHSNDPVILQTSHANIKNVESVGIELKNLEESVTTPSRRSRRTSGRNQIEDKDSVSTPLTPLRRSRRLSGNSPSTTPQIYETPVRRKRKVSERESPPCEDEKEVVFTKSNSAKKRTPNTMQQFITPVKKNENITTSDTKNSLPVTPLPTLEEKPPLSKKKTGRKKVETPQRVDTPRRRSSRLSASTDALGTIVEEEKNSEPTSQITPSKITPSKKPSTPRTKKSIGQYIPEPLLETISEDSEISHSSSAKVTAEKVSIEKPPVLKVISSPVKGEITTRSVGRPRRNSLSSKETPTRVRKAKSASVSPQNTTSKLEEIETINTTPAPRTTQRSSVICEKSNDPEEGKENIGGNTLNAVDKNYSMISPFESEKDQQSILSTLESKRRSISTTKRTSRRKSNFTLTTEDDVTNPKDSVKKKTTRKKKSVSSSSALEITTDNGYRGEEEMSLSAEVPVVNNVVVEEKNESTEVSYNLLSDSEDPKKMAALKATLAIQFGKNKRGFKSIRRRLSSMALPPDDDTDNDEETVEQPPQKTRKISQSRSKAKSTVAENGELPKKKRTTTKKATAKDSTTSKPSSDLKRSPKKKGSTRQKK